MTREITIRKVMNGFVVRVGCQELVFEGQAYMLMEIGRYLAEPEKVEREYLTKYLPDWLATTELTPNNQRVVDFAMQSIPETGYQRNLYGTAAMNSDQGVDNASCSTRSNL
jgi:hypothetical protein